MRVTTTGFKAHDIDVELNRLTVLVARNGEGKSTIPDAIRFCVLGYLPRLGRTLERTAKLLRGREMTVRIGLDNGHWFTRTLCRKGTGSFESTCRASWCESREQAEHAAAILELFGGSKEDAEEALDFGVMLALPENQRAARIQALLERGQDFNTVAEAVARRWTQLLADVEDARVPPDEQVDEPGQPPRRVPGYTKLRPLIPGYSAKAEEVTGQYACAAYMADDLFPKLKEVGVAGALTWANEAKRNAQAGLRKKKQARAELAESMAELPEVDDAEIQRLEGERAELDRQIGAAGERQATLDRQQQALTGARAAVTTATAAQTAAVQAREAYTAETANLPPQLASVTAALDALQAPALPNFADAEALERDAAEAQRRAEAVVIPTVPDVEALRATFEATAAAYDRAAASPWARVETVATELARNAEALAKGKRNKVLVTYAEGVAVRTKELIETAQAQGAAELPACKAAMDAARTALATAEGEYSRAQAAHVAATAERDDLLAVAAEKRASAEDLRTQLNETYQQERALYEQQHDEMTAERDRLRAVIASFAARDTETAAAVTSARQALDLATQRLADLEQQAAPATETAPNLADLQAQRDRVQAQLATLANAKATRDAFERLVKEIDALTAEEVVTIALEKALQRVRTEEIQRGAEPLLSIMREVLEASGRPEVPYLLGWTAPDGDQVDVAALCGGHFVLYAAALFGAMQVRRSAPLRLLLIESAEADAETFAQVMAGISAIADRITGAVLCSPHQPARVPAGWVQMTPSGERVERAAKAA